MKCAALVECLELDRNIVHMKQSNISQTEDDDQDKNLWRNGNIHNQWTGGEKEKAGSQV